MTRRLNSHMEMTQRNDYQLLMTWMQQFRTQNGEPEHDMHHLQLGSLLGSKTLQTPTARKKLAARVAAHTLLRIPVRPKNLHTVSQTSTTRKKLVAQNDIHTLLRTPNARKKSVVAGCVFHTLPQIMVGPQNPLPKIEPVWNH